MTCLSRHAGWLLLLIVLLTGGCATYADRLAEVREQVILGDLSAADAAIEDGLKRRSDRDVLELDRAIVQLASGKPKKAEQTLRLVRDRFDHHEQPSVGEKALSMLTDANAEAYAGEDYEKVLVRVFLALSNLMSDGGDAGAYALQVGEKQQQIIATGADQEGNNPKYAYQRAAVGAYIHGALREATHSNYDDVARSCMLVCSWQPDFIYGQQDLMRAQSGRHSAPGNGVLYVFTLVGVGPHKEETVEIASTVSLLVADRILSATGKHTLPPNIAPIKVPKVVLSPHDVGSIGVAVNGYKVGQTATITDIGKMAVQQYDAIYPQVIGEAVARRVVKKAVVYGAKELTGTKNNTLPNLAFDLAGIAWEASESADTRCWGMLPDKIQVLRVELPAGQHKVALQALGYGGNLLGRESTETVDIANGRNTYLLAHMPYGNLAGTMLTNQP